MPLKKGFWASKALRVAMLMTPPMALPSFFHSSQSVPSVSRNGLASIAPPRSAWQISGPSESSRYGPCGAVATARPTHCRPDSRPATV